MKKELLRFFAITSVIAGVTCILMYFMLNALPDKVELGHIEDNDWRLRCLDGSPLVVVCCFVVITFIKASVALCYKLCGRLGQRRPSGSPVAGASDERWPSSAGFDSRPRRDPQLCAATARNSARGRQRNRTFT